MAVLKQKILALGMGLPFHGWCSVVIAADTILRVIILVAVVGIKILACQSCRRKEQTPLEI